MIYGLYLSAAGVQVNSHRQDVIANNLANVETVGFKRDLAMAVERRSELAGRGLPGSRSNRMLEALGGGVWAAPTRVDASQGEMEHTGNGLDLAIVGSGYFQVAAGDARRLTRDGRLVVNHRSRLALASNENMELLDPRGRPITVDNRASAQVARDGTVSQNGQPVGRIGVFDVPDPRLVKKSGGTMLTYPDMKKLRAAPAETSVRSEYIERANVDPSTELAALMDAQRQLEANANMIRYQDQMLSKLVNEVGKIG